MLTCLNADTGHWSSFLSNEEQINNIPVIMNNFDLRNFYLSDEHRYQSVHVGGLLNCVSADCYGHHILHNLFICSKVQKYFTRQNLFCILDFFVCLHVQVQCLVTSKIVGGLFKLTDVRSGFFHNILFTLESISHDIMVAKLVFPNSPLRYECFS